MKLRSSLIITVISSEISPASHSVFFLQNGDSVMEMKVAAAHY